MRTLLVPAFAVIVTACATVPTVPRPPTFADLPELAAEYWAERLDDRTPGVVAAFFERDAPPEIVALGYADPAAGRAMRPDTVFQVASISKAIAALGVLAVAEAHAISLSDPVERYLTRYSFPRSRHSSEDVTIERLLSHTAGLTLTGYPGFSPGAALPTIEQSLAGETGRFFGFYSPPAVRIRWRPGSRWRYSGGGYTVLQLFVEEVSGTEFGDYMAASILEPAGMVSSTFDPRRVDRSRLAVGHDSHGDPLPDYLFTAQAAAGLYATAGDLAQALRDLDAGVRGDGRLLDADSYRAATTPCAAVSADVRMGLGVHLEQLPDGSTMAFHYGANRGWQSFIGVNLATGDGLVILTNSDNGIDLLINPVLDAYRRELTP